MDPSLFTTLPQPTPDAIFSIGQQARAAGPDAIDGTIGIYMDEDEQPMMFPSVQSALTDIGKTITTRSYSYPPLTGLPEFRTAVHRLIFGERDDGTVASIATTGGTGAVAINLRLAKLLRENLTAILPSPTWANHRQLCTEAGLPIVECPYLTDGTVAIDGIVDAVKRSVTPAVVILHVGCHNPTGLDLKRAQWEKLLPVLRENGAIALLDFAYQGFGGTPEEDAWPVRHAAELGVTTLVCWSASKNHSIYSERVGLAAAVAPDAGTRTKIEGHYMVITRKIHSAAATFGQSIVARVQSDHREQWLKDVVGARSMMERKRTMLKDALPAEFHASLNGFGMFAMLPLSPVQVDRLANEMNVFLTRDGRINVAGIPLVKIGELAEKIAHIHAA